ncbi:MAG: MBOAT family protein [Magnetococcales bacterium]|nr:MBOAT family protein [Magnetococcales bacterium]
MSFTESPFHIFFLVVFLSYHAMRNSKHSQNIIIIFSSYFFYGWWDWRFLALMMVSSLATYGCGLWIEKSRSRQTRKKVLLSGVVMMLTILGFFKYYNFFISGLATILPFLAKDAFHLNIVLPIGISFYTFQAIAYMIDVYRGQFPAERSLVCFTAFKAFFPQLVAGPIERADHLLVQFHQPRTLSVESVSRGIWLIIYGYFLKLSVGDTMARIAETAFIPDQPFGWWLLLGSLAFSIQIYADFHGYSLIAKGLALLLGFDLIFNFNYPYWSCSIREFWQRWHISLSRWLRDYLYIPLRGSQGTSLMTARNLMLTMLLGGLWHGANWTFILWGGWHGLALVANHRLRARWHIPNTLWWRMAGWLATMIIVIVGWFFFRAQSVGHIVGMVAACNNMEWVPGHSSALRSILLLGGCMTVLEWTQVRSQDPYILLRSRNWLAACVMGLMVVAIMVALRQNHIAFIYFQF